MSERLTDKTSRNIVGLQKFTACGAGLGPTASRAVHTGRAYPEPRFVISVTECDHTDLFALGIPWNVDDKPVVVIEMGFATVL